MLAGVLANAQTRVLSSYTSIKAEMEVSSENNEHDWVKANNLEGISAYLIITLTDTETYIAHYLTNGLEDTSFVYKTVVWINNKTILDQIIKQNNKYYHKTDSNNWYYYQEGYIILVNWNYNYSLNCDIMEFSIKND